MAFCGAMNMPPPVTRKNYRKLSDRLGAAVEKVAKTSMIEASVEVNQQEGSDIGISFDGPWQKKGTCPPERCRCCHLGDNWEGFRCRGLVAAL